MGRVAGNIAGRGLRTACIWIGLLAALVALLTPTAAQAGIVTTPANRTAVADIAVGKQGSPYRTGAAGPKRFDCSGLVVHAYSLAGVPLSVRTSQQLATLGVAVSRKNLKRGDLVFTWSATFGHVGIYLGNGTYVHAPGTGRKVEIAALPTGKNFNGARRV